MPPPITHAVRRSAVAVGGLLLAACSVSPSSISTAPTTPPYTPPPATMTLTSPAFVSGGLIPAQYTCVGAGVSPPLDIGGVPAGTRSLALVVDEPDTPEGDAYQWLVFDIPPAQTHIAAATVPPGARQATADSGEAGYEPLCPAGTTDTFQFTVYALDSVFTLADGVDGKSVRSAIEQAATARAILTGTVTAAPESGG